MAVNSGNPTSTWLVVLEVAENGLQFLPLRVVENLPELAFRNFGELFFDVQHLQSELGLNVLVH